MALFAVISQLRVIILDEENKVIFKMEEVICLINLANSALFARLIRQIVSYLPDYENLRSCKGTYIYGPVRYRSDNSRVTRQEWQVKNGKSRVTSEE